MKSFHVYLSSGRQLSFGPWTDAMVDDVLRKLQDRSVGWSNLHGDNGTTAICHAHIECIEVKSA